MIKSAFIPVVSDFLGEKELEIIIASNLEKLNNYCVDRIGKTDILKTEKIKKGCVKCVNLLLTCKKSAKPLSVMGFSNIKLGFFQIDS